MSKNDVFSQHCFLPTVMISESCVAEGQFFLLSRCVADHGVVAAAGAVVFISRSRYPWVCGVLNT
jgi:hypothetical protein